MSECVVEKLSKSEIAKKAWITIRAKKLEQALKAGTGETVEVVGDKLEVTVKKKVKKEKVETEKEAIGNEVIDCFDKKELDELNGVELKKLAKGNGKKAEKNIKKQMKDSEARAIEIGGIMKIVIENVNAGIVKKEDQDKVSH
jgi:hypothetical protein